MPVPNYQTNMPTLVEVQEDRRFIIQYFIIWQLKYEDDCIDQDSNDLPFRKRLPRNYVISHINQITAMELHYAMK